MLEHHFFQENHLCFAHRLWQEHLLDGENAIDATCGRGSDLLALANRLLVPNSSSGKIFVYDIQRKALEIAKRRAESALCPDQLTHIVWIEGCHSKLGMRELGFPISLIVYNLGYLPGGDKELTSRAETTRCSLLRAGELLQPKGMISAMCYPGHQAGAEEAKIVEQFAHCMAQAGWGAKKYRRIDAPLAPHLITLTRDKLKI